MVASLCHLHQQPTLPKWPIAQSHVILLDEAGRLEATANSPEGMLVMISGTCVLPQKALILQMLQWLLSAGLKFRPPTCKIV